MPEYTYRVEAWSAYQPSVLIGELEGTSIPEMERSLSSLGGGTAVTSIDHPDMEFMPSIDGNNLFELWVIANDGTDDHVVEMLIPREPQADSSSRKQTSNCVSLAWVLTKRFVGRVGRDNQVTNGGFETGDLTGWTVENCTATVTVDERVKGTYSVRLEQADADQEAYIKGSFTSPANGVGIEWTMTGWRKIDPTDWIGPPYARRGLLLQRGLGFAVGRRWGQSLITRNDKRGVWLRDECTFSMPPDTADDVEYRIYAVGGTVWWDEISIVAQESISFPTNTDIITIAEALVAHAQDEAYGKTDLGMTGVEGSSTVEVKRTYQFAEYAQISSALDDLARLEPGGSWGIWGANRNPRFRQIDVSSAAAAATWPTQILNWRAATNFDQAANAQRIIGNGDGPDREEGGATSTVLFGGLTLESVDSAPPATNIDALDRLATTALARKERPAQVVIEVCRLTLADTTVVSGARAYVEDLLQVGQCIDLTLEDGRVDLTGRWVIESMRLHLYRDVLQLDLRWGAPL